MGKNYWDRNYALKFQRVRVVVIHAVVVVVEDLMIVVVVGDSVVMGTALMTDQAVVVSEDVVEVFVRVVREIVMVDHQEVVVVVLVAVVVDMTVEIVTVLVQAVVEEDIALRVVDHQIDSVHEALKVHADFKLKIS
jgi:hypothetical protein